ncbi:hypothetical protein RclHR1_09870003 [Rhizophagus clarus]|uniref:Uncharacterized protein n=1 Tax=Rhizophagus clarus TaxID=94130 RepID=A0A2Z6S5T9_9GLOM|nr:hypothetical protein RclHR1_09870003 [Rhizophagus clarus]
MESVYDERVTKPIKQRTLEVGVGEPIIVSDSSPIKKNDLKLRGQGNQTMKDIIFAGIKNDFSTNDNNWLIVFYQEIPNFFTEIF